MANLTNTLYPPTVATFMPAFIYSSNAVVFFSLSPYNEAGQINNVHVSVVNQSNNENALKNKSGILSCKLNFDSDSGMYYVVIPTTAMNNDQFGINQFYKVQLRFDQGDFPTAEKEVNSYLLTNQTDFSEWSTVCLLRPIAQPSLVLKPFDTYDSTSDILIGFNKGLVHLVGTVVFGIKTADGFEEIKAETEKLQSYQIQILDNTGKQILLSSPTVYTGDNTNQNTVNYRVDLQGLDSSEVNEFKLKIICCTTNQYVFSKEYDFQINDFLEEENFLPELTVKLDDENGIAHLNVVNEKTVFGTLYIRRSSSLSDFKVWEDIYVESISGTIDIDIYDNTVGSLTWYRYSAQLENSRGALTQSFKSDKFLPNFYDCILSRDGQQLKLKYNYNISSFKPVVNRSKVDTLGGRYPKFAENAMLNYKQFSISGLITADLDAHQKFLNKTEYLGSNTLMYEIYKQDQEVSDLVRNDVEGHYLGNGKYLTTTQDDWLWEREFREEVIKWLNDGEPKLYRSMTEGSMVVMLTDISLTPNKTLGRFIWDFSATVYEIEEADSLTTLDTLGIYTTVKLPELIGSGSGSPQEEYIVVTKPGQLYQFEINNKNNILETLKQDLEEKYGGVLSNRLPNGLYLKNVKIFFQSKPHIFYESESSGGLQEVIKNQNNTLSYYEQFLSDPTMKLGYTFNLGNSTFFVNERGYYQLPNSLTVDSLSFNQLGDIVTIEYTLVYKEANNTKMTISSAAVAKTVIGQYQGVFESGVYLGEKVRAKYNFLTSSYYQRMQSWRGISLDVTSFAVVDIKYKNDKNFNTYVVGTTGVLNLLKDYPISEMVFQGMRMKQRELSRQKFLKDWEFVVSDDTTDYTKTKDITNPQFNTVYTVAGQSKIYYQDEWFDITIENDGTAIAKVPVEGLINYYGDIVQSNF